MKTIRIKDYFGIYQEVPVSDEFYQEWVELYNEFQRTYRREMYHRDCTELHIAEWMMCPECNPIEEKMIEREDNRPLYEAIAHLTRKQQRRVRMYMDGMTCREIADDERCTICSVEQSLKRAFAKLRRLLTP